MEVLDPPSVHSARAFARTSHPPGSPPAALPSCSGSCGAHGPGNHKPASCSGGLCVGCLRHQRAVLTVGRALFQALWVQIDVCTGVSRVYRQDQLPVAATTKHRCLQTTQTDSLAVPEAGQPEARCQLSCF